MCIGLRVRAATGHDAQAAVEVIRRSISELCTADHRGDPATLEEWLANKTAARFRGWLARSGQYTVVVERDGTLCGVGMMGPDGSVRLCYVHPDHTRCGVGRALVDAMQSEARARGMDRLHLDATLSAMAFYEAMGFRRVGSPHVWLGVVRSQPYEKRLSND